MAILQRGCCCTLRTCVCVLGWICVVLAVLALAGTAYVSGTDCDEFARQTGTSTTHRRQIRDSCINTQNAFYVQIFFTIVWLICSILLLVGVYKENRWLLLPYIIAHSVMLIYFVITAFIQAVNLGWTSQVIVYIICAFIGIGISVYVLLCVISHYQNLRDGLRVSGGGAPKV